MAGGGGGGGSTFGVPNNSSLAQPGQVLSGQALIDAAKQLANAQTQGPLTELARQIAQNNTQGANAQALTSKYFNELGGYMQQGVQDQRTIGAGLNQQLGDISNQENLRLAGIQADSTANMQKYAPGGNTGLNAPAMQSLGTELARQQGLAAQNEGAFRAAGALQGANQAGLQANQMGAYSTRGQEMLGDIGRATQLKNEPLTAKMAALKAQEGALFSNDLGKLRQQEIVNQDTAKTLGIKQDTLNQTIANDRTRNQISQQNADTARQNANTAQGVATNGNWYDRQRAGQTAWNNNPNQPGSQAWYRQQQVYIRTHGGPRMMTPKENVAANTTLSNIIGEITKWQTTGLTNGKGQLVDLNGKTTNTAVHPTAGQLKSILHGVDPTLLEAALELRGWGSVDARTAKLLKSQGYDISNWSVGNGQRIKITPSFNPAQINPIANLF